MDVFTEPLDGLSMTKTKSCERPGCTRTFVVAIASRRRFCSDKCVYQAFRDSKRGLLTRRKRQQKATGPAVRVIPPPIKSQSSVPVHVPGSIVRQMLYGEVEVGKPFSDGLGMHVRRIRRDNGAEDVN